MLHTSGHSLKELRTKHGILAAEIKTTIHCNWLTYSYTLEAGKVGLEGIFEKAYGKAVEMESSNDTDYSWDIKKEELSDDDQKSLSKSIANGSFTDYELGMFLVDLCNKGVIPEAHYVVRVSW